MTNGRTRTNNPERTKKDILDVATREFAENGFSGASINMISELTKTSKRMIYYYFGSKDGLFRSVIDANYQRVRDAEARLALDRLPPLDAIVALTSATFDFHTGNIEFVRLIMVENVHHGRYTREIENISQRNLNAIEEIRKICERGVEEGVIRRGIDPIGLHLTISALCFHYVSNRETFSTLFQYDMHSPAALAVRRQGVIDTILRSVRA